LEDLEIDSNKV